MAPVQGATASSMGFGSMLAVLGSMSTNTGCALLMEDTVKEGDGAEPGGNTSS